MAQQTINVGASANDGLGDPIRTAFIKCNDNFTELYSGVSGISAIANGNSTVSINTANGNIAMSVGSSSNVAVITTTGITVSNTITAGNLISTGAISAVGNITGNYIIGNGSLLTGLVVDYSNANVAAFLPTYNGNISAGNVLSVGVVSAGGAVTAANVITPGIVFSTIGLFTSGTVSATGTVLVDSFVDATGNVRGGNINTNGIVNATGNVIANNFVGAGAGNTTLSSSANLNLSSTIAVSVTGGGTFRLPNLTSSQIANLTPSNGDLIYNTTVNKIQGYENGSWGNLI